jgi:hypothetical protein
MMISTGHRSLAEQISRENNYAYLEDMHYPEIEKWAEDFGFTLKELMWVQPNYGPNCAPGTKWDACYNNRFGCLYPAYNVAGRRSILVEYLDSNRWTVDSNANILVYIGARIGVHRFTITDSLNVQHVFYDTIYEKPKIQTTNQVQNATNQCNGKITVVNTSLPNSRGPLKYEYHLQNISGSLTKSISAYKNQTIIFDSLCTGNYLITVNDTDWYNVWNYAIPCRNIDSVHVGLSTSLENFSDNKEVLVHPNPFENHLSIRSEKYAQLTARIYQNSGKLMHQSDLEKGQTLNLEYFPPGIYILQLFQRPNQQLLITQKIVKLDP